jgi:membrane protease YdiL (CAAX protease family)
VKSLSYAEAVAWTLAVTALLIFGMVVLGALDPALGKNLLVVGVWEVIVYGGACGVFVRTIGAGGPRRVLALKAASPGLIASGAALGAVLQLPANSLAALAERLYPTPPEVFEQRIAQLTPSSPWHGAGIFLVVALVVPFVEELFFRGALFGALLGDRARGRAFGTCAVTALCFVAAHLDPRLWLPLSIVAVALSHLRYLSGSLWPCLALHASFNALTLLAVFSGQVPRTAAPQMSFSVTIFGWVAAVALWWLVYRLATRPPRAPGEAAR